MILKSKKKAELEHRIINRNIINPMIFIDIMCYTRNTMLIKKNES